MNNYKVESKSIKDSLCELIRNAIITGDLKPEERIIEKDLAEKFNTSRTPLREAIQILESEKLVTRLNNRGVYISSISEREFNEIYEVRLILEKRITEQVTLLHKEDQLYELNKIVAEFNSSLMNKQLNNMNMVQLGDMFHIALFKIYNNNETIRIYEQLQNRIKRYAYIALNIDSDRSKKSAQEHINIYNSIKERNPYQAKSRMENHILEAQKTTLLRLKTILS